MRFFSRTPVRTFIVYPAVALTWELVFARNQFPANLWFLPLMLWGYLQYRLCGRHRSTRGGGGPGVETPPERWLPPVSIAIRETRCTWAT